MASEVIGLLFRFLLLPIRLVLLPLKVVGLVTTFVTCIVPLIILVAIGATIVWFLFIR